MAPTEGHPFGGMDFDDLPDFELSRSGMADAMGAARRFEDSMTEVDRAFKLPAFTATTPSTLAIPSALKSTTTTSLDTEGFGKFKELMMARKIESDLKEKMAASGATPVKDRYLNERQMIAGSRVDSFTYETFPSAEAFDEHTRESLIGQVDRQIGIECPGCEGCPNIERDFHKDRTNASGEIRFEATANCKTAGRSCPRQIEPIHFGDAHVMPPEMSPHFNIDRKIKDYPKYSDKGIRVQPTEMPKKPEKPSHYGAW